PPATQPPTRAVGASFVRVPAEKLDALLTHSGELLVARRRVESRIEELTAIREFLGHWRTEWHRCGKPLRALQPGGNGSPSGLARRDRTVPGGALSRRAAVVLGQIDDNLRRLEKDLEHFA